MKNLLIVLLAVGLAFVSWKWASSATENDVAETEEGNAALENIMTRTSVRSYTSEPVSDENIETLLRAAMAAPTAGNKQPWRFVVVKERALLDSIGVNFHTMKMAARAPVAILVCGDTTASFKGRSREYWVQDASAAMENLLLAAHAIDLGAVWCGIYPREERVADFKKMFSLSDSIVPLGLAVIGHPEGKNRPKDKWKPENILQPAGMK